MTTRVFVYGTLKRGHGNNRLLHGAEFISEAISREEYGFYKAGIPYVYKSPKDGDDPVRVIGELWDVDQPTLAALDRLEGHPTWYRREIIQVMNQYGKAEPAYIYFMQGDPNECGGLRVSSGMF